jgi:hypothetical protein
MGHHQLSATDHSQSVELARIPWRPDDHQWSISRILPVLCSQVSSCKGVRSTWAATMGLYARRLARRAGFLVISLGIRWEPFLPESIFGALRSAAFLAGVSSLRTRLGLHITASKDIPKSPTTAALPISTATGTAWHPSKNANDHSRRLRNLLQNPPILYPERFGRVSRSAATRWRFPAQRGAWRTRYNDRRPLPLPIPPKSDAAFVVRNLPQHAAHISPNYTNAMERQRAAWRSEQTGYDGDIYREQGTHLWLQNGRTLPSIFREPHYGQHQSAPNPLPAEPCIPAGRPGLFDRRRG